MLNEQQKLLVENNIGLVGTVIKDNVRNVNSLGIFTYDDIFQIGCLGLSKAALNYIPGNEKFSTCAYIYIRNEIFNALDYASVRRKREDIANHEIIFTAIAVSDTADKIPLGLNEMLVTAKARATGVAAKGIDAIVLKAEGYSCKEIGEIMGGISANNITAWISKARAFLKKDSDFAAIKDAI